MTPGVQLDRLLARAPALDRAIAARIAVDALAELRGVESPPAIDATSIVIGLDGVTRVSAADSAPRAPRRAHVFAPVLDRLALSEARLKVIAERAAGKSELDPFASPGALAAAICAVLGAPADHRAVRALIAASFPELSDEATVPNPIPAASFDASDDSWLALVRDLELEEV